MYAAYRAASALARRLPERSLPSIERLAGRVAPRLMPGRAAQVERNLSRVYGPDLSVRARAEATADTFASYVHYWSESFRLPGRSCAELDRDFVVEGMDRVERSVEAGEGTILALPHLGGWEWAAFWLTAVRDMPVTAVVEPVEPPELAEWFVGLREALGMEIVTLGPDAGSRCLKALRENRILALLCDRDLGGDGVAVELFGEETTLPAGPATLALRTGATLLPAAVYFDGRGHRGVVRPPLDTTRHGRIREDVSRVTGRLAGELEGLIRAAPEQWHLLQPNWPSDRLP